MRRRKGEQEQLNNNIRISVGNYVKGTANVPINDSTSTATSTHGMEMKFSYFLRSKCQRTLKNVILINKLSFVV